MTCVFHSAYLHLRVHRPWGPPRRTARASAASLRPSWSQRHSLGRPRAYAYRRETPTTVADVVVSSNVNVRTNAIRKSAIDSSSWEREQQEERLNFYRNRKRDRARERDVERVTEVGPLLLLSWEMLLRSRLSLEVSVVPRNGNCSQSTGQCETSRRVVRLSARLYQELDDNFLAA